MGKTYDTGLHGYFDVLMMCFSTMLENIQGQHGVNIVLPAAANQY